MLSFGACGFHRARWRLLLIAPLVLVLAVLVAPGVARASGVLDQSQTDTSSGAGFPIRVGAGPSSLAQTFTAGVTGGLDRVDIYLQASSPPPSAPITVEIRDTSSGQPGSTVLASASVPATSVTPSGGWVEVDFASPAPVTSETQYAIVAYTSETTDLDYVWVNSLSNDYSGGQAWLSSGSPPTSWFGKSSAHPAFKTYVEPSATTLAATLVRDSTGKGPGSALASKAAAIQTAVNASPPQTATACAAITNYLGLVKCQTGKTLTKGLSGTAALLTTDANNLAAPLGC